MKKSLAVFVQVIVVLIGISVFVFMLWEPHFEGRNINATVSEVYFNDPFLAYAYVASISFFVGVYKTFKLFGYIGQNKLLSQDSLHALRTIKYCAITLMFFIAAPMAYLFIVRPGDDIAGGIFMGLLCIAVSGLVASVATRVEKTLQKVV